MNKDTFLNIDGLSHVISDLKTYLDTKEFVISAALNDLNDQIINKDLRVEYDTTANWNARRGYIPKKGTLIVYCDYKTIEKDGETVYVPGFKVGSGNGYVQDLAFVDEAVEQELANHIDNNIVHITNEERNYWNNKLNVSESNIQNEELIFNRS